MTLQGFLKIARDVLKWLLKLVESFIEKEAAQPEGRDPAPAYSPVKGRNLLTITGAYPKYTDLSKHSGLDFACKKGADIVFIAPGKVISVKVGKRGKPGSSYVKVKIKGGKQHIYKHCKPIVKKGDHVEAGQTGGTADLSGRTTGYHLHFECKKPDGKRFDPILELARFQPGLRYKFQAGRFSGGRSIRDIYEKYNPAGLKIIETNA